MAEKKPKKPPFEVTPGLVLGCSVAMVGWLVLMGVVMMALKLGAGSGG